jgi:hypothetical protein
VRLFYLHPKVPAQANSSNGSEIQEPVRKVPHRVKIMTMFKMTEKVKSASRKLVLQAGIFSKQGSRVSSLIRIQIEEIKRKVRICSPEALRFIGPGDK